MSSLINLIETKNFLTTFAVENDLSLVFLSTLDGGLICCNDIQQGKIVVEALSTIWTSFPEKQWNHIHFEWESILIILVNCGDFIFGIQQEDPNPSIFGLLLLKSNVCANHIKKQFEM